MAQRRILVLTGTRAEYGLLRSVIEAIQHPSLQLNLVVTGTHLLPPAFTEREVAAAFPIAARLEAQRAGETGHLADVTALGRLISGMPSVFQQLAPEVVVVLGDRLEAFGGAVSASLAGIHVAHLHGGDRAEGIADEALRHAISKLAHLHFPATETSAERLRTMGESPAHIHIVGSPALDDLADCPVLDDETFRTFGMPNAVMLFHPTGYADEVEEARALTIIKSLQEFGPLLALHPNHDPGRQGIMRAIESSGILHVPHLSRPQFIGLLRRVKVLVGNSSAGLIECAALGLPVVNIGSRQNGRERAANVIDCKDGSLAGLQIAARNAINRGHCPIEHPFGHGQTGIRVAEQLATIDLGSVPIRKCNTY